MAESNAHHFGQIIGEVLESAVLPVLQDVAANQNLFLDHQGDRPARSGKKVTWVDGSGNSHDLDFVFERGGTPNRIGAPVAFIESAWRRYTKHSRNKAQEIQGALLPLAETYRQQAPFLGAILAGEFTKGALTQLESLGFSILYFSYATILSAFASAGLDASFDEHTPESEFKKKLGSWKTLSAKKRRTVSATLLKLKKQDIQKFADSLVQTLNRRIIRLRVLPLHGTASEFKSLNSAVKFISQYDPSRPPSGFNKFEIQIFYSNGDRIQGEFNDRDKALLFLAQFPQATG